MSAPFFPEVTAAWQAAASAMAGDEIPIDAFLEAASKFVPIFGIAHFLFFIKIYRSISNFYFSLIF
jgi:hypothetical protein